MQKGPGGGWNLGGVFDVEFKTEDTDYVLSGKIQVPFAYNGCPLPESEDLDFVESNNACEDAINATSCNASATRNTTAEDESFLDLGELGLAPCEQADMYAGCACGSEGGDFRYPDNPFKSTGFCCDEVSKVTAYGDTMSDSVWCSEAAPARRRRLLAVGPARY